MLTLQIACGIWLGGAALAATFWAAASLNVAIEKNKRYGRPWHSGIISQT